MFPPDWEIPLWPNMTREQAGKLKTVRLGGFKVDAFNEEFLEGPGLAFFVQGKRTFWQVSGQYFLYWCQRFNKWRIAGISGFSRNKNGDCLAFVSDGSPNRDVLDPTLIKGWIEVEKGEWKSRADAGVVAIGSLADQLPEEEPEEEDVAEEGQAADCDQDNASEGDGGFIGGQKKANCPVMPVVRKVKEKVKEKVVDFGKVASKWARRLFPQLMGPEAPAQAAPAEEANKPSDEEDAENSRAEAESPAEIPPADKSEL